MRNIFDNIYLIGHGAPACMCADVLRAFNLRFSFVDDNGKIASFTAKRLQKIGVEPVPLSYFLDIAANENLRTLIFSVNNLHLFSPAILKKSNITIINYHNSLLPLFRGMHAEAWAIFTGSRKTGITWHLVDENIDTGGILFQEAVEITGGMTSIELLHAQACKAMSCLRQNIARICSGELHPRNNDIENGSIYYKKDRPGNGILDPEWHTDKIWQFLRAMDYGPYYNLGQPRIKIGAKEYFWKKYYRKDCNEKEESIKIKGNSIIINNTIFLEDIY